jgi:hypothetical protein
MIKLRSCEMVEHSELRTRETWKIDGVGEERRSKVEGKEETLISSMNLHLTDQKWGCGGGGGRRWRKTMVAVEWR